MKQEVPGTVIAGRYRLIGPIGRGANGTVYKALDPVLNRVVAVKVLESRSGWPKQALAREAQATSTLTHPNILRVLDFVEAADSTVIVVEYIEGRSLADIFRESGPLDQNYAIEIAAAVGSALAFAHRRGIVHRDVKPSNVLISTAGRVLLADFGLAIAPGADTLTSSGTILGTPRYMSPEQALGRPLDGRSDIYSLAIVVHEALCGEPWFHATGSVEILEHLVTTPVEPIRQRNPKVSADIERVLAKALAKQPADRYHTADQFVQALRDAALQLDAAAAFVQPTATPSRSNEDKNGGNRDETGAFISPGAGAPVEPSLSRPHSWYLLAGFIVSALLAAQFMPQPASTGVVVVLLAVSAWWVLRMRATTAGPGQPDETVETGEAAPYRPPSAARVRGHMFGHAGLVDAPTAETPAYVPSDIPAALTLRDPTAGTWLLVLNGPQQGRQFSLGRNVAIGRSSSNSVVLDGDPAVSRRHAEIVLQQSRFHVRDLRSNAGTLVNNVRVRSHELRDRDEIRVGGTTLLFISAAETGERGAESKRRLLEFSAIWNDLIRAAHDDE